MEAGPCRLCEQVKPLMNSHVLPEFVYRPTYDKTHTAIQAHIEKGRLSKRQRGFTERLFCADCESIFNRWETYFSNIWLNPTLRLRPPIIEKGLLEIPGIDYVNFKLFHISIVWRAGISSLQEFSNVQLGIHEARLRELLRANHPGDPDLYPIICIALRDPTTGGLIDSILAAPEASRNSGQYFFSFIFGGVRWVYVISDHRQDEKVQVNCIRKDGILRLAVQDWTDNLSIRDLARRVQKNFSKP